MSSTYRSSYSTSLTSSVLDYRHENGRRYHKYRDGCRNRPLHLIQKLYTDHHLLAYLLPNDEAENDRLDMLHELCLEVLHRKLYLAPIGKPQRVIDLATGTGLWAIDFGKPPSWVAGTGYGC